MIFSFINIQWLSTLISKEASLFLQSKSWNFEDMNIGVRFYRGTFQRKKKFFTGKIWLFRGKFFRGNDLAYQRNSSEKPAFFSSPQISTVIDKPNLLRSLRVSFSWISFNLRNFLMINNDMWTFFLNTGMPDWDFKKFFY